MSRHFASRQVRDAMASRNDSNVTDIHPARIDLKVHVYQQQLDMCDGPFDILGIDEEDVTVLLRPSAGLSKFGSTVVMSFLDENVEKRGNIFH